MSKLNPLTLAFTNSSQEAAFLSHTYGRTLMQGRIGLILGSALFLLFGLFDRWSIPEEYNSLAWTIRVVALLIPMSVFVLTFTQYFRIASHLFLASLGLAANLGFLCIFVLIPLDKLALFYPSIALTTVATYFLVGTRFIYALSAELIIFLGYNMLFVKTHGVTETSTFVTLLMHDFFLLAANVIGGAAGYMQELQNRRLFLREVELDQERQHHLNRSLHDSLTGLPNRDLLCDRLKQALAQRHRKPCVHACFFIDLDGFKLINDNLGHTVGDKLLQVVAARLSTVVRDTDTVARLGGDEFFVLCQNIQSEQEAQVQALRLLKVIEDSQADGMGPSDLISASIGICIAPYSGATVNDIILRADKAMYAAKQNGRGQCIMASNLQQLEVTQTADQSA
jgi:diguanylate cyclase